MEKQTYTLWKNTEYSYPMSAGFLPFVVSYVHSSGQARPAMLVVPGGGYCFVSPTEAEPVALEFYRAGYNAFVLTYTVNPLTNAPLHKQPLMDISRAVRLIRSKAAGFRVDPDKLAVCGFSAGGHLCASLCVHWKDVPDPDPRYAGISNRPNAAILSYPVITAGEYAHRGSFDALLGQDPDPRELEYMSLEKQVAADTPPCFLWQTAEDDCVPVENSYLFARACHKAGVRYAHHVFTSGQHGLSLANDDWLAGKHGDDYSLAPVTALREWVRAGKVEGAAPDAMEGYFSPPQDAGPAYRAKLKRDCASARVWTQLAVDWLDRELALSHST